MATYLPRAAWTSTPRPDDLTDLDAGTLLGVVIHYTGSPRPLGDNPAMADSVRVLEAERRDHVEGRQWRDIAYQVAIDQAGRVFDCRGIEHRSAANGSAAVNARYGAVTFLIGVGDRPTPALLAAFRDWWASRWLDRWPHAKVIVGHRDVHSTDCPGEPVAALIRAGTLAVASSTSQGDDVALSDRDIARLLAAAAQHDGLLDAIADRLMSGAKDGARYKVRDGEELLGATDALGRLLALARETPQR